MSFNGLGFTEHVQGTENVMALVNLALLTGNYNEGARLKLQYFDLWRYFTCGAFGEEAAARADLVPVVVQRARACGALTSATERIVVIGDTPHDVACAHAGGAVAVAVATLPVVFSGRTIAGWEGAVFLGAYAAYVLYLILAASQHDALPWLSAAMLWFVLPITALTLGVGAAREWRRMRAANDPRPADGPRGEP